MTGRMHYQQTVTTRDGKTYQVESDGRTVWINSEGCCAARFSESGILADLDVMKSLKPRKGPTTLLDWVYFRQSMLMDLELWVDNQHKPMFLRQEAA